MTRYCAMVLLSLALAISADALELRAVGQDLPPGCESVIVEPSYLPPPEGPNPCIVAEIPPSATRLTWLATELWELTPTWEDPVSPRLECEAEHYAEEGGWSLWCRNVGVLGRQQPTMLGAWHSGTAEQLDVTVRAWWAAQR